MFWGTHVAVNQVERTSGVVGFAMGVVETLADFRSYVGRRRLRHDLLLLAEAVENLAQVFAGHVLHSDVILIVEFA